MARKFSYTVAAAACAAAMVAMPVMAQAAPSSRAAILATKSHTKSPRAQSAPAKATQPAKPSAPSSDTKTPSKAKATKIKFKTVTLKGKLTVKNNTVKYSAKVPVLTHANKRLTKVWSAKMKSLVKTQNTSLAKERIGEKCTAAELKAKTCAKAAIMKVTNTSSLHQNGKYVSATLYFVRDAGLGGNDDVRASSATLSMKTGHFLKLSNFIQWTEQSKTGTYNALVKQQGGQRNVIIKDATELPLPSAWSVAPQGVRMTWNQNLVGFGYQGAVSVVVPWNTLSITK